MSSERWRYPALAAAVVVLAACGDDGTAPVSDAGTDAGAVDAGRDAGSGRRDGGRDAGVDGGADAGRDPGEAGWRRLDVGASFCRFERADHPEVLFTAEWVPCGDVPGCVKLADEPGYQRVFGNRGYLVEGTGYFTVIQASSSGRRHARTVLLASTEGPLAAWRVNELEDGVACGFREPDFDGKNVALGFGTSDRDTRPELSGTTVRVQRVDREVANLEAFTPLLVERVEVASSGLYGFAQSFQILGLDADGLQVVGGAGTELGGSASGFVTVGDDVLWEDWGRTDGVRFVHGRFGQPPRVLVPAPADGDRLRGLAADDRYISWHRVPPDRDDPVEVWAAPFTTDPEALAPRHVATLPIRGLERGGDGMYALDAGWEFYVVDLATGTVRVLELRGLGVVPYQVGPTWVSKTELAMWNLEDGRAVLRRFELARLPLYEEE